MSVDKPIEYLKVQTKSPSQDEKCVHWYQIHCYIVPESLLRLKQFESPTPLANSNYNIYPGHQKRNSRKPYPRKPTLTTAPKWYHIPYPRIQSCRIYIPKRRSLRIIAGAPHYTLPHFTSSIVTGLGDAQRVGQNSNTYGTVDDVEEC